MPVENVQSSQIPPSTAQIQKDSPDTKKSKKDASAKVSPHSRGKQNQVSFIGITNVFKCSVQYKTLCDAFALIEATTKRLEIQSILTDLFVRVIADAPKCLIECVYLCINRICPEYEGKELGVGESLLMKAVANATGRDAKSIKSDLAEMGDLGSVAQAKGHQKTLFTPKPLTVSAVFKALKEIANISGQSSQQRKVDVIQKVVVACSGTEAKYLIRSLEGKLRIGLAEQTVLVSLAHSIALSDPRMSFTCEYKYDGERAQIHKLQDGTVAIYSRNLESLTGKYPDVIVRLPKAPKPGVESFVLDCEAVAWDTKRKCILPFQVLSTRKRKDVQIEDVETLTAKPFKYRRELLYEHFNEIEGEFEFAKQMTSSNIDEIQTFLDDSVVGNCEGLMVKTLEQEASYEPSKRSRNWLKVKKDYINGLGDSLDLVVVGGYLGRGKRTGWYGGYLLACYDDDRQVYQTICKIATGFSEKDLADQIEFFKDHVIAHPPSYYTFGDSPNVRPDVWFSPVQVWEVKAADLSISPVHKAAIGLVDPNKGISLRFPRFIRVREDKKPEQATTAEQVADMYRNQNINTVGGSGGVGVDDDFEY
eukprot:jgi/Hompol1/2785/HPOL_000377-RA